MLLAVVSLLPFLVFEGALRVTAPLKKQVGVNRSDKDRKRDINIQGVRASGLVPSRFNGFRILALGDSFTSGLALKNQNTWPKQTERELLKNFDNIEVLNGAKPGLDTTRELRRFREKQAALNPDLVVVGFLINDCTRLCSNCGPVKVKKRVDNLISNPRGLDEHLYLFRYLHVGFLKRTLTEQTISAHLEPYQMESSAYKECTQAFKDFKDLSTRSNFKLAVIIYPMLFRLDEDYPFTAAHKKIMAYLESLDIAVHDLSPAFFGHKDTSLWVKPYDSHPNAKANRIAASAAVPFISQFIPERFKKAPLSQS